MTPETTATKVETIHPSANVMDSPDSGSRPMYPPPIPKARNVATETAADHLNQVAAPSLRFALGAGSCVPAACGAASSAVGGSYGADWFDVRGIIGSPR